ncbi:hypothetical protein VW35_03230 [Devosia soli]|uniref:HEPN domain-containing protein n=2 Tax=Devosia soli TaxID=361041 RepID=A0A0F5LGK1_9HYPH|nr:hypothetical protein VW35_03230 [Devosia soli]
MSSVTDLIALADEYFRAAQAESTGCKPGRPLSTAPFRLLCIHAIELYLNAFLRHAGEPAPAVRGLQHNLAARLQLTDRYGLVLRVKTRRHIEAVSENREYLVSRYAPEALQLSEINRLKSTLTEVRVKVVKMLARPVVIKPNDAALTASKKAKAEALA